ncbi:MAG: M20/M25/M40 family metallo-hydrolase [Clostridia bacterium]|nr:M20/M25/M40 family metallo-hydrolase [Clostridia bacterium]
MNQKESVVAWLDGHKSDLQQLLSELIRIPSVTGEEYAVQMAVKSYAEKYGLAVETCAFDEAQKRPCVLVTYQGNGAGKYLLLDAHSDTVPVAEGDVWEHPPFSGDFDGTWIYGRGAADDKWGIATALMTLRALKECGVELAGDVSLLSSVGEEVGIKGRLEVGSGAMVASMKKKPDFCIVCEESGNSIGTEAPCNIKFTVKVRGKAAHSCGRRKCIYPQNNGTGSGSAVGVDGLQKAMLVLDAFYRLERELSVNHNRGGMIGTGRAGIGAVTINPIRIEGGGTNSLIPLVTIDYNMHYSPAYTKEEMLGLLQDTLQGVAMTDLWLRENPPIFELFSHTGGFCCDPNHPAIELLRRAGGAVFGTPAEVAPWPAGCDADVLEPYAPTVVYGPSGAFAHGPNERGNLQKMVDSAKVYALTAMDFCK